MDIDRDVARWMVEFLLRQPLDDAIFKALISVLPPTNDYPGLMKTIVLREIESEVSNGSVSEKMLGLLEKYEELAFREGIEASETLRAAYCAVAVDCTVRCLKNSGDENSNGEYFTAVKRIWRQRICRMEKDDRAGLASEELWSWKDRIEAALWQDSFCEIVIMRSEWVDAVGAVQVFVNEAKEKMGPSFLEYMAETLHSDDHLREIFLSENKKEQGEIEERATAVPPSSGQDSTHHNNDDRGLQKGKSMRKKKHVACKRTKAALVGTSRGAKIADNDDLRAEAPHKQYDLPDTPEVKKVQKALETSTNELQAVVKDPLPDALLLAATIMCNMSRGNMGDQPMQENPGNANCPVVGDTGVTQTNGGNVSNQYGGNQTSAPKQNLMERNSTAQVLEWEDSVENSLEGSPSHGRRPQLPSPRKRNISPLKEYEIKKIAKRRERKKWSSIEEETLRTGVEKFGKGNWKLILNAYRGVFEERTEVDLKDKWRNMTRY